MSLLTEILHDFVDMIFPTFCLACREPLGRGEQSICTTCITSLPYTDYHQRQNNDLSRRFWGKVPVEYSLAYLTFSRSGRVQRLLHQLKYSGARELGTLLGRWYGSVLLESHLEFDFDLVVPVPLHKAKQRQRGYNQAELFANGLSESLEIPLDNSSLQRQVHTATQTKKGRLERWQNVGTVFAVIDPEAVKGKHVLLVDDVITTGATLEACVITLLQAGCSKVSIAAIAAA